MTPDVTHALSTSIRTGSSRKMGRRPKPTLVKYYLASADGKTCSSSLYSPELTVQCPHSTAYVQVSMSQHLQRVHLTPAQGSQLAEMTLFLICAVSLAAFEVSKPVVDGVVIEPSMEYTPGTIRYDRGLLSGSCCSHMLTSAFISHPVEFQCSIKLRTSSVDALLSSSAYD